MKNLILLALALPSLASAQAIGTRAAELRDAALAGDTVAWDFVEGLTTEVGPRVARRAGGGGAGGGGGGAGADRFGLFDRPERDFRHAGLGARRGKRRDRLALPAAA